MVECEFSVRVFLFVPASVLIDTWWNVNKDHIAYTIPVYPVLIDTWWNVNAQQKSLSFQFWRF